jgi:hypothetical protein
MADVVIKRSVPIPDLLLNCMDFGFQKIDEIAPALVNEKSFDTKMVIQYNKTNTPNQGVVVKVNNYTMSLPNPLAISSLTEKGLLNDFTRAQPSVSRVEVSGPYITYLLSIQDSNYIAGKFVIVAKQMMEMARAGLSDRELTFIEKFWSCGIYATLRHAVRPRLENENLGNMTNLPNMSSFKIPWHRNSNKSGTQKGFLVSGLYIHRPRSIQPESGGISFIKGNKQVKIYPAAGTTVSFFDQKVIHKVIAAKVLRANLARHGFVQRSAVFMSWFTTNELIGTRLSQNNANALIFQKSGIKAEVRDLKKLYGILNKYFTYIDRLLQNRSSVIDFLKKGNISNINAVYRGQIGLSTNNMAAWANLKSLVPAGNTVANTVLYKMYNTGTNNSRQKLKDLYEGYVELNQAFGGGLPRPGKNTEHHGGRGAPVSIQNSGFITVLP